MAHSQDWLNWIVRTIHLVTGIAWIGSSFYFMWLDSALEAPKTPKENVEGDLWMVHSGGFYQVEKRLIAPGQMPEKLHWFRWEAFFTWLSGLFLLGIVYYFTGGAFLLDPQASSYAMKSPSLASAIGFGIIIIAWLIYDALWNSRLADHVVLCTALCIGLLTGSSYLFCHLLSGRAAFIHIGAMMGTIMVANVWVRILPSQQKMIDATQEGRKPDYTLGTRAKRRSIHNSYMTFPVILLMLSNHYPIAYSHDYNWIVLLLLIFAGGCVRHAMIAKSPLARRLAYLPAAASLILLLQMTSPRASQNNTHGVDQISYQSVHPIIQNRCVVCHATHPLDSTFGPTPGGVNFETPERVHALAERIKFRAVVTKTMPLANRTAMSDEERQTLGRWIDQGAKIE